MERWGEAVCWGAEGWAELGAGRAPPSRPAAFSSGLLRFLMRMISPECGFHAAPDAEISLYVHSRHGDSVGRGRTDWSLPGSFPPPSEGLCGTPGWGSVPVLRCGQLGSSLEEGALWDGAHGLLPRLPTHLHWGGLHPPRGRGAWWPVAGACCFHQMEL